MGQEGLAYFWQTRVLVSKMWYSTVQYSTASVSQSENGGHAHSI